MPGYVIYVAISLGINVSFAIHVAVLCVPRASGDIAIFVKSAVKRSARNVLIGQESIYYLRRNYVKIAQRN